MNENLLMAEQQFTGFIHAHDGGDIVTLADSMGLTAGEWDELKESGEIDYMPEGFVYDLDQHFS